MTTDNWWKKESIVWAPAGWPTWACSEDLQPCRWCRTSWKSMVLIHPICVVWVFDIELFWFLHIYFIIFCPRILFFTVLRQMAAGQPLNQLTCHSRLKSRSHFPFKDMGQLYIGFLEMEMRIIHDICNFFCTDNNVGSVFLHTKFTIILPKMCYFPLKID